MSPVRDEQGDVPAVSPPSPPAVPPAAELPWPGAVMEGDEKRASRPRLAPLLPAAGGGGSCWNRCPDPAALCQNAQRWERPIAQPWVAEFRKAGRNSVSGPLLSSHPDSLCVLLVSGQVKEAETREAHLKNELKKHQIDLLHPNKVRLPSH